uniref:FCP1 homology domain-containing protein n=1 Tax=viral metagenome TaxID=1070528 RepID=A0A6C0J3E1_9ZZZZ
MIYDNNHNELIEVYKGKYFSKHKKSRAKKVVVLDLDETLGSFVDLEILWSLIKRYNKKNISIHFNDVLDIYPEFLRYGLRSILQYIANKKKNGECYKLFIYTNNQAGQYWTNLIINYLNNYITTEFRLFDQIINAFKINNIQVELNRTTHKKTHNDFIRCTLLPKSTTIFFVDDVSYTDMQTEKIYYIKPMPYNHHLSTNEIINRFIYSKYGIILLPRDSIKNAFKAEYIELCMKNGTYHMYTNTTKAILENDVLISRKIMYHLKEYFLLTNKKNKTCKLKSVSFSFTRKRYN